jgi:hypothetical protein
MAPRGKRKPNAVAGRPTKKEKNVVQQLQKKIIVKTKDRNELIQWLGSVTLLTVVKKMQSGLSLLETSQ